MVYTALWLVFATTVNAIFADVSEIKLSQSREIFYNEIGCEKHSSGYKCPNFREKLNGDKCFFDGREYAVGELIGDAITKQFCRVGCKCIRYGEFAKFECGHIDCAEVFAPPPPGNCITKYAADKCCSTGTVCGDDLAQLNKCEFEGDTYYEGQRMYAMNKCYTCSCVQGFDNSTTEANPNCRRQRCNILLNDVGDLYNGCAPVYYKNVCCPIEFRCPASTDAVTSEGNKTNGTCQFGNLEIGVGGELNSYSDEITCKCVIPPFIECLKVPL